MRVLLTVCMVMGLSAAEAAEGERFRDCPDCPEMIFIPAGSFTMGSAPAETEAFRLPASLAAREHPAHEVRVGRVAVGVYEVTRAEYEAFAKAAAHRDTGNCYSRDAKGARGYVAEATWRAPGLAQTDRDPVICIGWPDAKAYVAWLAQRTGKPYRLLSEAEWEYAARAGTKTPWYWGEERTLACRYGNVPNVDPKGPSDPGSTSFACDDGFAETAPVGSFRPNAFGLYDMLGNVFEWVEDCAHPSYDGAPTDGSAWNDPGCTVHAVRGGGWAASQTLPRSAARATDPLPYRGIGLGFRVARD